MSIDVALVNLDKREFLRPQDMGLRSEIRAVESVPTLFHVAAMRLVAAGSPWAGDRVALVHDAGGPNNPPPGLPSWDTICGRENGWRNILPEVIEDLVERHRPATDELFNGTIPDLLRVLSEYVVSLDDELVDAREDAKDGWTPVENYVLALKNELSSVKETLARLRARNQETEVAPPSADTQQRAPVDNLLELVRAVQDQCARAVAGCHYTEDTPDADDDVRELDASLLLRRARATVGDIHAPRSNVVSCVFHNGVIDVEFGDGFSVSLPCSVFAVPADTRLVGCVGRTYGIDLELDPPAHGGPHSYSSNWIRHQASLLPGGYNYRPKDPGHGKKETRDQ